MLSKQDKERLTAAEREYWQNERMVKHCVSEAQAIFNLRDKIVVIEKHKVETHFCFGYSCFGRDIEEAADMAEHAQNSQLYFLRKNHERAGYTSEINNINDGRFIVYAMPTYYGKCDILYSVCYMRHYDYEIKGLPENAFVLTDDELTAYKKALAEAAKEHHKKLAAYLKRYGLTKVNSWTYWQDE